MKSDRNPFSLHRPFLAEVHTVDCLHTTTRILAKRSSPSLGMRVDRQCVDCRAKFTCYEVSSKDANLLKALKEWLK